MIAEERIEIEDAEPTTPSRVTSVLRADSPALVYGAIAVVGIGFILIAVTWGLVAGTAEVARQIPYVISGGLSGLGCIIVGIGVLIVAIRRRESEARTAQYRELAALLRDAGTRRDTRGRR